MKVFRCTVCGNTIQIPEQSLNILKYVVKQVLNEEYDEDSTYISILKTCCGGANYVEVKQAYEIPSIWDMTFGGTLEGCENLLTNEKRNCTECEKAVNGKCTVLGISIKW